MELHSAGASKKSSNDLYLLSVVMKHCDEVPRISKNCYQSFVLYALRNQKRLHWIRMASPYPR